MTTKPQFSGPDVTLRDEARLTTQMQRVKALMFKGYWYTLADLARATGGSEAGVSARLRDLRKPRFGGYTVERERVGGGLWRYRMLPPPRSGQMRLL